MTLASHFVPEVVGENRELSMIRFLCLLFWLSLCLSTGKGMKLARRTAFAARNTPDDLAEWRRTNHDRIVSELTPLDAPLPAGRIAATAIARVVGVCGIGVSGAKAGLLTDNALTVLSRLTFSMFQPCLLFTNVATTIANAKRNNLGGSLYILPLMALFQISVGYVVGKCVASVVYRGNFEVEAAKQLLVCTTFSNSGPLPLVLIDSLFRNYGSKAIVADGTAYISFYLVCWSPLFWIIAPAILAETTHLQPATPADSAQNHRSDRLRTLLGRALSPPVLGSLCGLCVGYVNPLRSALVCPQGLLNPLFEAACTVGAAFIPTALLVLAGSLVAGVSPASAPADELAAEDRGQSAAVQVACIYAARFIFMPSISFGLAILISRYSPAWRKIFRMNPLLLFVLLLETCMPSAQNSTVIYQLQGHREAAGRLARVLMLVYVLGIPAMSFWLVRLLHLTGLARVG